MDPNANLLEQRELANKLIDCGMEDNPDYIADAGRLADLVLSLDYWIVSGGFLPDTWAKGQLAAKSNDAIGGGQCE